MWPFKKGRPSEANKIIHETVIADFYPIHERWMGLIFQTYTNWNITCHWCWRRATAAQFYRYQYEQYRQNNRWFCWLSQQKWWKHIEVCGHWLDWFNFKKIASKISAFILFLDFTLCLRILWYQWNMLICKPWWQFTRWFKRSNI